jgi:hypothetical protein
LREGDATGFFQAGQLGQALTFQAQRQRAERQDAGLADFLGTMDQTISQFRLIERRIGIGRDDNAGHAAGDGGGQFGFDTVQPGTEVDQAGADDAAACINGLLSRKTGGRFAQPGNLAINNK